MKFADRLCDELLGLGYTHCFFVAGGNIMHLVESSRTRFRMVPVIHEVSAVIGAEYFNETSQDVRAFALVTAGPGLTNAMTGIAGAWLESREVLIIGGQVKSGDLASAPLRQKGIQEIDGVSLCESITKASIRIESPVSMSEVRGTIEAGTRGRPGPVFMEICLDAQAAPALHDDDAGTGVGSATESHTVAPLASPEWATAVAALQAAERPLLLIGGGVDRRTAKNIRARLEALGIPVALTWNAFDRLPSDSAVYAGRPNTWGMRWSNIVIQQCDVLFAVGTRLGLQQTGFAWEHFAPLARIAHVDIDDAELRKGHPRVDWRIQCDANEAVSTLLNQLRPSRSWSAWRDFVSMVRQELPVVEASNFTDHSGLVPQKFVAELARLASPSDVLIPCSSGGAETVAMQVFANQDGQIVVSDSALASMGYGLAGAIGASLAHPQRRVILTEGDGGFAQNLQELGTVKVNDLNLKMFIMSNKGYASIRMTQSNYFKGAYVGCDTSTGLGVPNLERLAAVWDIPFVRLSESWSQDAVFGEVFDRAGPVLFEVPVPQEQPYWPKIGSWVGPNGSMTSAPLHLMSPDLDDATARKVMPYLAERGGTQ